MSRPDLLGIVEAAYRIDVDDASWIRGIVDSVDATLGRGLGCYVHFLDASDLGNLRLTGLDTSRLRIDLDVMAASRVPPEVAAAYYSKQAVGTGSGQVGARVWRRLPIYRDVYAPAGAEDIIGIVAIDAHRTGVVVGIPLPVITRLKASEISAYSQLAAHIATGHRLRCGLISTDPKDGPPRDDRPVEAVLRLDGTLEHAEEAAKTPAARQALRRLATNMDRARGELRRKDVDRALEVWTALVAGRWTLLDHFESDGRRYLVARRNDPAVAEPAALSLRERQVVAYAGLGHPNKLICYELGLSASTVSQHLASAISKLGMRSRTELVAALGRAALAAVEVPPPPASTR